MREGSANTKFTKKFQTIGVLHIKFCPRKNHMPYHMEKEGYGKKEKEIKLNPYLWEELEEGQKLQFIVGLIF